MNHVEMMDVKHLRHLKHVMKGHRTKNMEDVKSSNFKLKEGKNNRQNEKIIDKNLLNIVAEEKKLLAHWYKRKAETKKQQ